MGILVCFKSDFGFLKHDNWEKWVLSVIIFSLVSTKMQGKKKRRYGNEKSVIFSLDGTIIQLTGVEHVIFMSFDR
jgi:hypothetical protein